MLCCWHLSSMEFGDPFGYTDHVFHQTGTFSYFFKYSFSYGTLLLELPLGICWHTLWCSTGLWGCLFFFLNFPLCFLDWITSVDLFSGITFFLPPARICCCFPLLIFFSFQFLYFSTPAYLFDSFFILSVSLLIINKLVKHYSHFHLISLDIFRLVL